MRIIGSKKQWIKMKCLEYAKQCKDKFNLWHNTNFKNHFWDFADEEYIYRLHYNTDNIIFNIKVYNSIYYYEIGYTKSTSNIDFNKNSINTYLSIINNFTINLRPIRNSSNTIHYTSEDMTREKGEMLEKILKPVREKNKYLDFNHSF